MQAENAQSVLQWRLFTLKQRMFTVPPTGLMLRATTLHCVVSVQDPMYHQCGCSMSEANFDAVGTDRSAKQTRRFRAYSAQHVVMLNLH